MYSHPTLVLHQWSTPVPFKRTTPRILGEGIGEMVVPEWDEWKATDRELELSQIHTGYKPVSLA